MGIKMPKILRRPAHVEDKSSTWENAGAKIAVIAAVLCIASTIGSPVWGQYNDGNKSRLEQVKTELSARISVLEQAHLDDSRKLDRLLDLNSDNGKMLAAQSSDIKNLWAWVDPNRRKEGK